jgi:cytochrome c oxidase cbb3-type subunit 2
MRTGPDLLNIGVRQPSRDWHMSHLFNPRTVVAQSVMPPFSWLFQEKTSADPTSVVVDVAAKFQPRPGVVIVATPEAVDLVNYLLGMDRTYRVRE